MSWAEVERKARAILETLEELRDLNVRGPLGMPLDYPIERMKENLRYIRERMGEPKAWLRTLKTYADTAYRLAEGYAEAATLKSTLKRWGMMCVAQPVYNPEREVMEVKTGIVADGIERARTITVPCRREEYETRPEACNTRVLERLKEEKCALLARNIPTPAGRMNLLVNPRTLETVSLTWEAKRFLKDLRRKIDVEV